MRLNANFQRPAHVDIQRAAWTPSPMAGVDRLMLDRVGEEKARATSLVRYAAGSHFSEHVHVGGEEFLVLDGVFSDETGDFPAGSYVRNPIGTRHAPHSDPGCVIFVKLMQFAVDDTRQCHVETDKAPLRETDEPGVARLDLHAHGRERVGVERWAPGAAPAARTGHGGLEILLLEGDLTVSDVRYDARAWLRLPAHAPFKAHTEKGARFYVKTGHLDPLIGAGAAMAAAVGPGRSEEGGRPMARR